MTTSTNTIEHKVIHDVSPTRKLAIGISEVLIALSIFVVFALNVSGELTTRFVMTPGGINQGTMPDIVMPSQLTLFSLAGIVLAIGICDS